MSSPSISRSTKQLRYHSASATFYFHSGFHVEIDKSLDDSRVFPYRTRVDERYIRTHSSPLTAASNYSSDSTTHAPTFKAKDSKQQASNKQEPQGVQKPNMVVLVYRRCGPHFDKALLCWYEEFLNRTSCSKMYVGRERAYRFDSFATP